MSSAGLIGITADICYPMALVFPNISNYLAFQSSDVVIIPGTSRVHQILHILSNFDNKMYSNMYHIMVTTVLRLVFRNHST